MSDALQPTSLTQSVSDALRKQIINGELQPGLRITEGWVAERFTVARPTAKAGLDRLTTEGLLRRGPRRSSMVPRLTAEDIIDIYYSRTPIESLAVSELAAQSKLPDAAEHALMFMRVAAERSLHFEHTEADVAFHRSIVEATASPRLARMHATVMGEAQLCIAQVRRQSSVNLQELTDRHFAIADAIIAGSPEDAVTALKADLDGCRQTLLDDIARSQPAIPAAERLPFLASCPARSDPGTRQGDRSGRSPLCR